jgi:hypothetical protein
MPRERGSDGNIPFHECLEVPVQTSLVEHDPVIQALAAEVPMTRST